MFSTTDFLSGLIPSKIKGGIADSVLQFFEPKYDVEIKGRREMNKKAISDYSQEMTLEEKLCLGF